MERSIIISSGRCGSTLLSDLVAEEPDTLSSQEFFSSLGLPATVECAHLTGTDYWAMLSSPSEDVAALFRMGALPDEAHYPVTGRWADNVADLPRILTITLPKLTDDPDALFYRLAGLVPRFPAQSIQAHHQDFLDLVAELLGRRRWVERSGGSSLAAPILLKSYPTARIVYLTRDWHDTAKSMSRHQAYQLLQLRIEVLSRYGIDPFTDVGRQRTSPELERSMSEILTAEALRERGKDVNRYVLLCAFMSGQVEQALTETPPQHLLRMTYEELLADPVGQLTSLGEFLSFDDPSGWASRVAHRIKPSAGARGS